MRCPACSTEVPAASRFCPSCGAAQTPEDAPTLDNAPARTPTSGSGHRSDTPPRRISSGGTQEQARFVPGTVLAERYRIVAPLGKGGMGEVYRAEDLKLEQTVALKFLPAVLTQDGAAQARFHREVRVARQVAHPNVCRMFDIGETDGLPFLSMEYVDGEDLKSLLRRIGRFPPDKALDIARQICAGLAAAHEFGILHRDLKPANIMLDARGKVRVTDFGLASLADEIHREEVRAGTPAYMAPEQMAGQEVTARSDIYSLGLVLYEVFTGKHAFDSGAVVSAKQLEQTTPTNPSQIVKDIDPIVERVILRCLEQDPRKRPSSALQVAAALPGGDPLAAALAAGETPSPEMVAAAGETEGLRPAIAWACLAGVIACTLLSVILSGYTKLYRLAPLEKPPEALAEKARDLLASIGYTEAPADTAVGFGENFSYLRHVAAVDKSQGRWSNIELGMGFWYRSSSRPLAAERFLRFFGAGSDPPDSISPDDPPLEYSGMTLVWLTPRGKLTHLRVVPPQFDEAPPPSPAAVDWKPLFAAAGLDPSQWTSVTSTWTPPVYSDLRAAWTGALPERPGIPMRIEAAAYRGKPVYFDLIGPWNRPERMGPQARMQGREVIAVVIAFVTGFTLLCAAFLLARRNIRTGRGDRKGAARLAVAVFILLNLALLAGVHSMTDFFRSPARGPLWIGWYLFPMVFAWMLYIALEPYVRRRWPATLISWARLLSGRWRDPVVGRDILAGCLVGTFSIIVARTVLLLPTWFAQTPLPLPYFGPEMELVGGRILISSAAGGLYSALQLTLVYLFLLFLLRLVLKKDWLAGAALVLIFSVPVAIRGDTVLITLLVNMVQYSARVFLLIRFGIVATAASLFVGNVITVFPLTTDAAAWYAGSSLVGLLLIAAFALYGFYFSLGSRPMFGGATLEE